MQCSLSGETPQKPAVSLKSGNVFERRLIEVYVAENGKDPVSGEEMTLDDLIDLKTDRTVRPRPPTFTSIPSLLSAFQNEWDALVLSSYAVRQQLTQTRQELSTALYQHDAAVRVIARLTKERDEARNALSQITASQIPTNGDVMQIDSIGLSEELKTTVEATTERLSKTRKKRPIPEGWVTDDQMSSFAVTSDLEFPCEGARSISVNNEGVAIIGGSSGHAGIFHISDDKFKSELNLQGEVTDTLFCVDNRVAIASSIGVVKIFDGEIEVAGFTSHAGAVNGLALHPSGAILASVGADKSFTFYDMSSYTIATQVYTESALNTAAFHPDGHLFATGGLDGKVKIYLTTSLELGAEYSCGSAIENIVFSENGFWFAVTIRNSTSITIYDIRKDGEAAKAKVIDIGSRIDSMKWDYTGQFLATAGAAGVTVQQYNKGSKSWSEPLRSGRPATALAWGPQAKALVTVNAKGVVVILSN